MLNEHLDRQNLYLDVNVHIRETKVAKVMTIDSWLHSMTSRGTRSKNFRPCALEQGPKIFVPVHWNRVQKFSSLCTGTGSKNFRSYALEQGPKFLGHCAYIGSIVY